MSASKVIKNPEVPGLECLMPPPPPPPPPVPPSTKTSGKTPQEQHSVANPCTVQPPGAPFQNIAPNSPYFLHPAMQTQAPVPPAAATPWWVPSDADSSEMYDSTRYAQWYEATYNATANANNANLGKTKSKYYKRKSEFIDPAQDAEKVASAQRELSALMKPLKCDLCNAVMNSTLQAKLHYDGKPHQKKVSMFLNQSVKKLKVEDGQVSSTTGSDWNTYCEVCKTWFTSQTDATQHYTGKKHLRAANGGPRVRPSKKSQNQYSQVDSTGRFGIGMGFRPEQPATVVPPAIVAPIPAPVPVPVPVPVPGPAAPIYSPPPYPTPLRCDLCGVSANRQDQLDTHRRGARHLRMLKLNGLPLPESAPENETLPTVSGPIDYSIYRTPSGQYYCAPCNLSLNSESSFAQHIESKKHKNQLNPKSPSSAAAAAKKSKFKKK